MQIVHIVHVMPDSHPQGACTGVDIAAHGDAMAGRGAGGLILPGIAQAAEQLPTVVGGVVPGQIAFVLGYSGTVGDPGPGAGLLHVLYGHQIFQKAGGLGRESGPLRGSGGGGELLLQGVNPVLQAQDPVHKLQNGTFVVHKTTSSKRTGKDTLIIVNSKQIVNTINDYSLKRKEKNSLQRGRSSRK